MANFEYEGENLGELERILSPERLAPYRSATEGDLERAIRLYEQNVALSESLYGILQGLEVALRNSIHLRLAADLQTLPWYDLLDLQRSRQRCCAGPSNR